MKRNNTFSLITILPIILLILTASHHPLLAQEKADEIDKLMQLYYQYGQFNGAVLVVENGKVIFKKGYGLANMEWNIPNTPDTKFRLGSITKQFTSMLIMQLVEAGKIKLDGKITDYLPDYRKDTGEKITIHHLLTHSSGIPNYTILPGYFREFSRLEYTVDEFVENYCRGDLEFEPGSRFSYTNSGYFLLGAIIEKVTSMTYEEVLKEKILGPLNMKNTGCDHYEAIITKRASGYIPLFSGYVNATYVDMSVPYSAGGMYSTVEDLYLWDQALYTEKLISKKYKDLIFKPHIPYLDGFYAYGWRVRKIALTESQDISNVFHPGGINGFFGLVSRFVDHRHSIILLNNTARTCVDEISICILNILQGKPYDLPKKSVAKILYKKIIEKDVASAVEHYHNLKENYFNEYTFDEEELNILGYQLLRENLVDEAIEIFKLNVETYPEAFNTYDSLGDAYLAKGEKELAIKNYAKSLELNPGNTSVIEKMKKVTDNK